MILNNIIQAKFIEKENRFVWIWKIDNKNIKFHIWDTGRLKELLFNWNDILVEKLEEKADRKYNYRLICAKWLLWDFVLVNSLLHSNLIVEYFKNQNIDFKREIKYWDSRIDFLIWNTFIEVKWVSLLEKENNEYIAKFPDAPTTRWQKHLQELIGINKIWKYKAKILFLFTNNVNKFKTNSKIDKKFSELFYKFIKFWWEVDFLFAKCNLRWSSLKIEVFKKDNVIIYEW